MTPLEGKTILITGAAKRMGREIALRLYREGARVLIHYGNSADDARRTSTDCGNAPLYQANLESVVEIRAMFTAIERDQPRLDGLVNNAARFSDLDPLEIEEHDWDFIHSANLKATFFCCQAAARIMLAQGSGRIVNISSLGSLRPWARHAHYCASKAGVNMLTQALAKAWAPQITVNAIAPGVFPFSESEAERADVPPMIRRTPMQRAGTGEDVSDGVVFLLSATQFITGCVLPVDGGLNLA